MIAIDPSFRNALVSYGAILLLCGAGGLLGIYSLLTRAIKHSDASCCHTKNRTQC